MDERTAEAEIPARYHYAVVPHIMVDDAAAAIDFYRRAFGAREDFRLEAPGGECCTPRSPSGGRR